MRNKRISEIVDTIDELICDLLVSIRTTKTYNLEAFDKLHSLLDELETLLKDETIISKKLAGLLFFIYVSVNTEASYTNYTNPIFKEAGILEGYITRIFGDIS